MFREARYNMEYDMNDTIIGLASVSFALIGVLMVVMILLGAFKIMTTSGNDDAKKSAMQSMVTGIIGLVIVISLFAISGRILETLLA